MQSSKQGETSKERLSEGGIDRIGGSVCSDRYIDVYTEADLDRFEREYLAACEGSAPVLCCRKPL